MGMKIKSLCKKAGDRETQGPSLICGAESVAEEMYYRTGKEVARSPWTPMFRKNKAREGMTSGGE